MSLRKNKQAEDEIPFLKEEECVNTEAGIPPKDEITQDFFFCGNTRPNRGRAPGVQFSTDQRREIFIISEQEGRARETGIEDIPDPVSMAEEIIDFVDTIVADNKHLNVENTQDVFRQKINEIQGVTEIQTRKLYRVFQKTKICLPIESGSVLHMCTRLK